MADYVRNKLDEASIKAVRASIGSKRREVVESKRPPGVEERDPDLRHT